MAESVTKVSPPKSDMNFIEDLMKDIYLWKKKKVAFSILTGATATWILLNFYGFNYLTLVSWTTIALVSMFFLWGNLFRLMSKEEPDLSKLEVSEDFVAETVKFCRKSMEETVRWMFRIGAESDWLVFARTVACLWVLSRIGNFVDIQTCVFIGLVMALTVPNILVM